MTTDAHRRQTLEAIANTRDVITQAAAEGLVLRGQIPTWREDALARAGDYAWAGEWTKSREFAQQFQEG
jgi:hypothetical protein